MHSFKFKQNSLNYFKFNFKQNKLFIVRSFSAFPQRIKPLRTYLLKPNKFCSLNIRNTNSIQINLNLKINELCDLQKLDEAYEFLENSSSVDNESFKTLCFFCKKVKNGSVPKKLFNLLQERKDLKYLINDVNCNLLLQIFANQYKMDDTIKVFDFMNKFCISFSNASYVSLLKLCTQTKNKEFGSKISSNLLQNINLFRDGLIEKNTDIETTLLLQNTLLNYYCKIEKLETAREMFAKFKVKDIVTWNTLISGLIQHKQWKETIQLFQEMKRNITPDARTYSSILIACTNLQNRELFKEIKSEIENELIQGGVHLKTSLLNYYCKLGEIENAKELFFKTQSKETPLWNTMISGLVRHHCSKEAIELFREMKKLNITPDSITYFSLLSACTNLKDKILFKEIERDLTKPEFENFHRLKNGLLNSYFKMGELEHARNFFNSMKTKDIVTWNTMISCLIQHGHSNEAIQLFQEMKKNIVPDAITYSSIINACTNLQDKTLFKDIEKAVTKPEFEENLLVQSSLMNYYSRIGELKTARKLFAKMHTKDAVNYTSMILGLIRHDHSKEAIELFREMKKLNIIPDSITYFSFIVTCTGFKDKIFFKEIEEDVTKLEFEGDLLIQNSLLNYYFKMGELEDARNFFNSMKTKDIVTWNTMISCLIQHGHSNEAIQLFQEMKKSKIAPDKITLVSLSKIPEFKDLQSNFAK